jgi:Apoptosis inhibitory protein 5 (API5)
MCIDFCVLAVFGLQFIPQFCAAFPSLSDKSLSKLLDLVEDSEASVRPRAIHALPQLCTSLPKYATKIADVLGQLLLSDSKVDVLATHEALKGLIAAQPRDTLAALFNHVAQDAPGAELDVALREGVTEFLLSPKGPVTAAVATFSLDDQTFVVDQVKRILTAWINVPQPTFQSLFGFVSRLPVFRGPTGQSKLPVLLDILQAQSGLFGEAALNLSDSVAVGKMKTCFALAGPIARRLRLPQRPPKKTGMPAAAVAPEPPSDTVEPSPVAAAESAEAPTESAEATVVEAKPVEPYLMLDAVAAQALAPGQFGTLSEVDALDILKSFALSADIATPDQAKALLPVLYGTLYRVLEPVAAAGAEDKVTLLSYFGDRDSQHPGRAMSVCVCLWGTAEGELFSR